MTKKRQQNFVRSGFSSDHRILSLQLPVLNFQLPEVAQLPIKNETLLYSMIKYVAWINQEDKNVLRQKWWKNQRLKS